MIQQGFRIEVAPRSTIDLILVLMVLVLKVEGSRGFPRFSQV